MYVALPPNVDLILSHRNMVAEAEILLCGDYKSDVVSIRPDLFDPSKTGLDVCASGSVSVQVTRSESV